MDEIWVALKNGGLKNTISFFRFVKGAMNIIDLLGILPYFMSLLLNLITVSGNNCYQVMAVAMSIVVMILRFLRSKLRA